MHVKSILAVLLAAAMPAFGAVSPRVVCESAGTWTFDGRVVERGTHEELMQNGGVYMTLVTSE